MTEALHILSDADEQAVAALGRVLAAVLRPGDTVLLDGPVGAGKTHLARALIRARQGAGAEDVPSPTFTIVQTYDDPLGTEIWHADLYRLTHTSELSELGLDEAQADAICLIEWPDRMGAPPAGALRITLAETTSERRRVTLNGDPMRWPGIPRAGAIADLLHRAGWGEARVLPLAGDASARRYLRLHAPDGATAVLMDAAPGSCGPYLAMTAWLRDRGFHAPRVIAADEGQGLLLLEDLGDDLLARVLDRAPDRAQVIYDRIGDLIAELHGHKPPDFIPALDGPAMADQVGLFAEHYAPAAGARGLGGGIAPAILALHGQLCADTPPALSLRDFHAENVVWMGDDAPLGLLDFQDAVVTHPAYELASALQDARRDVGAEIQERVLTRYIAVTGRDPATFRAAYALAGAQRGLRILGIFARLCVEVGKPRYLDFMPRVWDAVQRDLAHPALAPLARAMDGIPAPTPEVIARIRQQGKGA